MVTPVHIYTARILPTWVWSMLLLCGVAGFLMQHVVVMSANRLGWSASLWLHGSGCDKGWVLFLIGKGANCVVGKVGGRNDERGETRRERLRRGCEWVDGWPVGGSVGVECWSFEVWMLQGTLVRATSCGLVSTHKGEHSQCESRCTLSKEQPGLVIARFWGYCISWLYRGLKLSCRESPIRMHGSRSRGDSYKWDNDVTRVELTWLKTSCMVCTCYSLSAEPQWKMELRWAKLNWVGLSWTEYADNLSLCQKMSLFHMKSEVFRNKSGWLLLIFSWNLHPTVF